MKLKCGNCGHEWEHYWHNVRPIVCENCGAVWLYADLPFTLPKRYICEIAKNPKSQVVIAKHHVRCTVSGKFVEVEWNGEKNVPKISEGKATVFEWNGKRWLTRKIPIEKMKNAGRGRQWLK